MASPVDAAAPTGNLLAGYTVPASAFDEAASAPQLLRPHWQPILAKIAALGPQELSRRQELAQRMLRENGVAYNAFGDPHEMALLAELDALPLLISENEWKPLTAALDQRARLLNLILCDLYGPQDLLKRGLLPPEFLYANPCFARALHGQRLPDNRFLHLYAADLARAANGQWWVVADRTEAPSGAGYALENRIVMSRMLPDIFHDSQVQRLASYFISLRDTLQHLARDRRDNPRIVLLSAGPSHPHYFEDAYLARYLGYTLVEGGDLAVRNNQVALKTLGGLLPVDVILRRVHDLDCDPLELRGSSSSGVAGLLQAARSGNVILANALGTGVVESPALLPFLPSLCRELLSEDLQLPSVATWWCGGEPERKYVLEHLADLVILPAFNTFHREPIIGGNLSQKAREELSAAIRMRPTLYAARERIARSCTPVWQQGQIQPWHVHLRSYLVAAGDGYVAMQGGLTRVSAPTTNKSSPTVLAAGRKDAWILSSGPVKEVSLLASQGQAIVLRRSGAELPSRVADNLYWLGRNVERAEGAARLLRTILVRLTSEAQLGSIPELPVLLRCAADQGQIEPGFVVDGIRQQLPSIEKALPAAVFDERQVGSLRFTLSTMQRVASIVRDRISLDSWRIINRVDQDFRPPRRGATVDLSDLLVMLNQVVLDLTAFSGLVMESMTRAQGWRFLDIGRRVERSLHTMSLLQSSMVEAIYDGTAVLESILEVGDSLMTYRSRYLSNLQQAAVLDLLMTDETNPRSLAYQLAALSEHVENLPRDRSLPTRSPEQRIIMSLLHSVRMVDVETLSELEHNGRRNHLERFLSRLTQQLPKLSDVIAHKYLIHTGPPRQLSDILPEERQS
ncbi:MAG TPA: circularly permuted type 2 ATP-grasp protein [Pirellulaceae bacterium]|nr:circularly permuted type 2 ATP-grasp protein [Pirellulaceae bacterium]